MKNIIISLQLTLLLQGIQTISACDDTDKAQETQRIAPNLLSRKNVEIEMLPITKKSRIESNNFPDLRALKKVKERRKEEKKNNTY